MIVITHFLGRLDGCWSFECTVNFLLFPSISDEICQNVNKLPIEIIIAVSFWNLAQDELLVHDSVVSVRALTQHTRHVAPGAAAGRGPRRVEQRVRERGHVGVELRGGGQQRQLLVRGLRRVHGPGHRHRPAQLPLYVERGVRVTGVRRSRGSVANKRLIMTINYKYKQ